jgi:glycosyltransferase involved in cell wall biosynthesis
MRIAFDAKRAFHNGTGLGHYSRTLIQSLASFYPSNDYLLLNPTPSNTFKLEGANLTEIRPSSWLTKIFSSHWRSSGCIADLKKHNVALYHGLSHEIPYGIHKKGIPSVVTMHDLIFERYPNQYKWVDRKIYRNKFKYACEHSDQIIAISQQTKEDLINIYSTPAKKITVCYQSCNPAFLHKVDAAEKERIRVKYNLPPSFYLSVGSIIERKNLLAICEALLHLNKDERLPLVIIGNGDGYKKKVETFIAKNNLEQSVLFLSDNTSINTDRGFTTATDFPAIYQLATALIYPSTFEGFGIPVLEGISSGIPVITSNVSCLPEAGGPGAFYVDPYQPEQIAQQLQFILHHPEEVKNKIELGIQHANLFTIEKTAAAVMNVYNQLIG